MVFDRLGFEASETKGLTCCPNPVNFKDLDQEAWLILAARNLDLMQKSGLPVMTLCSGCFISLLEAQQTLKKDRDIAQRIRRNLGELNGNLGASLSINHFARFIYDEIGPERLADLVVHPLKGLKLAIHNGCHFLRPSHTHSQFDDPDNPSRLDELVIALGARAVDYPRKMLCCGQTVMAVDPETSLRLGFEKLKLIKGSGADAIVLVCPSCMLQFDFNQKLMEDKFHARLGLPVFYLTELISLAMGQPVENLGLDLHRVKVLPLLERLGLWSESGSTNQDKGN